MTIIRMGLKVHQNVDNWVRPSVMKDTQACFCLATIPLTLLHYAYDRF